MIVLGLVLRILSSFLFYHTDTKAIYRDASLVRGGIRAAYENAYVAKSPLYYPPAVYVAYDWYQRLARPLLSPYYDTWMKDWGFLHTQNHPKLLRDLIIMKLPLMVADLLVGWFLYRMVKTRKKEVLALWLINPISLYAIYGFGQYDIWPVMFTVLGWWAWRSKKETLSYLSFGMAAALKQYAILLLPWLLILDKRLWRSKLLGVLATTVVYGINFLPLLSSKTALQSVFLYNLNRGIFEATIALGGGDNLPILLTVLIVFFLMVSGKIIKGMTLGRAVFVSLGLLFVLSHFNPQWFIWLLPFWCVLLVTGKVGFRDSMWWMGAYFLLSVLIKDKFVSWGLFKGVNNAFDSIEALRSYLDLIGIGEKAYFAARGLFAAAGVFLIAQTMKKLPITSKLPEKINWNVAAAGIAGSIIGVFLLSLVPVTITGRYFDLINTDGNSWVRLTKNTVVEQNISPKEKFWTSIGLRVKNVGLYNHDDVVIKIYDDQENLIREMAVNGSSIGDDFDLIVDFEPIADSAGKRYRLQVGAPSTQGNEILLMYNNQKEGIISQNKDEEYRGEVSYMTFYNSGNYGQNLYYSLKQIFLKI